MFEENVPANVLLSSDFGQVDSPYGDEGMAQFIEQLRRRGVSEDDLSGIVRDNPARLVS